MHAGLLGVISQFLNAWTTDVGIYYYIRNTKDLDAILLSIRPPLEI